MQYLVIGNGRVSRHFQYYFEEQNLSYEVWHRGEDISKLHNQAERSTHILLLIDDQAIEDFIQQIQHYLQILCF